MTNHQKRFMATTALAMLALALMVPAAHAKPIGTTHRGAATAGSGRAFPPTTVWHREAASTPETTAGHLFGRGAVRVPGTVPASTGYEVDIPWAGWLGFGSVLLAAGVAWAAATATRSRRLTAP